MSGKPTYEELEQRILNAEKEVDEGRKTRASLMQKVKELSAINMLAKEVASNLSLNDVLSSVYKRILSIAKADLAVVYLLKGDTLVLPEVELKNAFMDIEMPQVKRVGECLCGLVAERGMPVYSNDIHNDPRCTLEECKKAGIRSFAALPLMIGPEVLGVLGIGSCHPRDFGSQTAFLEALASQVAIAFRNSLLHDQLKENARQLEERLQETKRALEERNDARRGQKDMFDAIGHPTVILDADQNILAANPAIVEMTGKPAEELVGKKCYETFHGSDRSPGACPMKRMVDTGRFETVEMEIEALGGLFLVSCTPVLDEKGELKRIIHVATDITKQKQAEKDRLVHLQFFKNMEQIEKAIGKTSSLEEMMEGVLQTALSVFSCDRAWLMFPCDPEASSWSVPMECTRPQYPGAFALGTEMPLTPEMSEQFKAALESEGPLVFDPSSDTPLPDSAKQFSTQAAIIMAIHPKIGKPWLWGISQCSHPRVWTNEEQQCFQEIGHRISDSLSSLLSHRDLKESEERFSLFMDHLPAVVFMKDCESRTLYVNRHMKDVLGVKDWIGKTPFEIFPREIAEPMVADDKRALFEGFRMAIDTVPDKHGIDHTYQSHKFRIDRRGKPPLLGGIAIDITRRKRAEEELRKYERIVSTSTDLMSMIDRDYVYQAVNDASLNAFGKKREDVVGLPVSELVGQGVFEEKIKPFLDRCLAGEEVNYRSWFGFPGLGHKFLDVTCYPFFEDNQRVSGIVVNFRDITHMKQLENRLVQAQKMEAIGTLAGGIAHDFNNILGAIIGYSELVQDKVPEKGLERTNLGQVLKAAGRAKDLVQQILAFSRQSEQEEKPIQIGPLVKEALKMLRASIPTTIEIRQNIQKETGTILADPTQIHQVLMNLCANASHAMQDKGGVLEVNVEEVDADPALVARYPDLETGRYVKLTVQDTGHGMDPETVDRIFDPYFTTKEKGVGTGLGLSVVHGIVKGCEGTIGVKSEKGKGTTFDILLPSTETGADEEPGPLDVLPKGKEHILFVDDEDALVDIGRQMLETLGYRVEVRTSPMDALEAFQAKPDKFDLIITDMTMPQMTGDALAERLMAIRNDIPVILCTGFSHQMDEAKAMALGIKGFVMKPIVMRELAETVRNVLDMGLGLVRSL